MSALVSNISTRWQYWLD